ncbi:MAG: hypothetical protein NT166_14010 [Candidatus Aminicenantes bacterium]|jgi:hypothetical protein|nr:hypothetical protein [Candidatus Aminicenantes bacterium]
MTDGESDSNRTNIGPKTWNNPYTPYTPQMSFHDLPFRGFLLAG